MEVKIYNDVVAHIAHVVVVACVCVCVCGGGGGGRGISTLFGSELFVLFFLNFMVYDKSLFVFIGEEFFYCISESFCFFLS